MTDCRPCNSFEIDPRALTVFIVLYVTSEPDAEEILGRHSEYSQATQQVRDFLMLSYAAHLWTHPITL